MEDKLIYGVVDNMGVLCLNYSYKQKILIPNYLEKTRLFGPLLFKYNIEDKLIAENLSPICRCNGGLKDFILTLINTSSCKANTYLYRLMYSIANSKIMVKGVEPKRIEKIYTTMCIQTSLQETDIFNDDYLKYTLRQVASQILRNSIHENEKLVHTLLKSQPTRNVPFEISLNDDKTNYFDNLSYHSICVNVHYLNREFTQPFKLSEILEKYAKYCLNYNLVFNSVSSTYVVNRIYDVKLDDITITL